MNKRIKELCIASGAYEHYEVNEGVNGDELPMQKFAELIVRECAGVDLYWLGDQDRKSIAEKIKQHFGVE
jgi:hypothetical protein